MGGRRSWLEGSFNIDTERKQEILWWICCFRLSALRRFPLTSTESLPAAALMLMQMNSRIPFQSQLTSTFRFSCFPTSNDSDAMFRRMLAGKWELPAEDFSMLRHSQLSRHRKFARSTSLRVSLSRSFVNESIFLLVQFNWRLFVGVRAERAEFAQWVSWVITEQQLWRIKM